VAARFVRIDSPKTILERTTTAVKKTYHMVDREAAAAARLAKEFMQRVGRTSTVHPGGLELSREL
jgi:hypothetical protein